MSLLLLLLLVLPLSNCKSSKETVKDDLEETMYKNENMDRIQDKIEELEKKLETKNAEVENLQKRLTEMEVQFGRKNKQVAEIERKMDEVILNTQSNQMECKAEVKKEVDKVLPTAVEQGLRDLPYEMVCAYRSSLFEANSIVTYDQITVEASNSNQPGGSMNIETGVFTAVTSGYYIITYSGFVLVLGGEWTVMYLFHNGAQVLESRSETFNIEESGDAIRDQGSRTVVSTLSLSLTVSFLSHFFLTQILHLLAGDMLDLRSMENSNGIFDLTLCLYIAPAPYGL